MIGWLDCSSGVSGDMLLGALVAVGVDLAVLQSAVDAVTPEPVTLRAERVDRAGLAATKVHVHAPESTTHRRLRDIRPLLQSADALPSEVAGRALAVFERLAAAEARVHGTDPEDVSFHEVGALDAIADVVAACAGLHALGLSSLVASPVSLGGGTVQAAHGRLPVPGPAVVELLAGAPTSGGPVAVELTTPTGAALLAVAATSFGHQPAMTVERQGFGAGSRDLPGHPNALRLVVGQPAAAASPTATASDAVLVQANVDDLDPRLWPSVIEDLIGAGASDAWLTPILMKKGRPAHTVSALVAPGLLDDVEHLILTSTSTIGLRRTAVSKRALERRSVTVTVGSRRIAVKLALLDGEVVNAQPEYEDSAAAAAALGRPLKTVMAQALAAFHTHDLLDDATENSS
ncbi:MAG: nickel pincer cofactor biosynthesis protein LarC [Actinomycetes bacterium]